MNGLQFNYFPDVSADTFFTTCLQLVLVWALVLAGHGIFGAAIGLFITDRVLLLQDYLSFVILPPRGT